MLVLEEDVLQLMNKAYVQCVSTYTPDESEHLVRCLGALGTPLGGVGQFADVVEESDE